MDSCSTASPSNHLYAPRSVTDKRSPCPALNALANHGYIRRSGSAITFSELFGALRDVFHLSVPLALLLTIGGFVTCGHWGKLDLDDLAEHGGWHIEHDASLAHRDAAPGQKFAPISVDHDLLLQLLSRAPEGHGFSLQQFARARAARELLLNVRLGMAHSVLAQGECSMVWLLFKDQKDEVPLETLRQFYSDERLPDAFKRPAEDVGLTQTHRWTKKIGGLMEDDRGDMDDRALKTSSQS